MSRYIIRAEAGDECNPDFSPDSDLAEGFGCDGFMIVAFKDGKPAMETMMGVSTEVIKKWIRTKSAGAQIIRQACAMAEGELRAAEIYEEDHKEPDLGSISLKTDQEITKITEEMMRKILGRDRPGRGS